MGNDPHLSHMFLYNSHLKTQHVNGLVIVGTVDVDTALNTCGWSGVWTVVGRSFIGHETDRQTARSHYDREDSAKE